MRRNIARVRANEDFVCMGGHRKAKGLVRNAIGSGKPSYLLARYNVENVGSSRSRHGSRGVAWRTDDCRISTNCDGLAKIESAGVVGRKLMKLLAGGDVEQIRRANAWMGSPNKRRVATEGDRPSEGRVQCIPGSQLQE